MKRYGSLNTVMQIGLVGFTALGFLLTALKLPQYGLVANLISQIFWLYSSYQAWRQADGRMDCVPINARRNRETCGRSSGLTMIHARTNRAIRSSLVTTPIKFLF